MRWHVAAAALMLALLVAAGVWYARPSSSATQDPVAIRNQIAQSAAVVVTFFVYGVPDATTPRSVLPDPPAMTFIRGGWVWQAPAGPGDAQGRDCDFIARPHARGGCARVLSGDPAAQRARAMGGAGSECDAQSDERPRCHEGW